MPEVRRAIDNTSEKSPRLLDQVRDRIRTKHYSLRTETTYVHWIKRFILFHGKRHPKDIGAPELEEFLSHLATDLDVAASTQNLALSALLFLYKEVLEQDLPWLGSVTRAKKPQRLPTVLSRTEVERLMAALPDDTAGLIARLLYGTGMRLMEGVRLRVKDVDLQQRQITVREGKGGKDRVTVLPQSLIVVIHDAPHPCPLPTGGERGQKEDAKCDGVPVERAYCSIQQVGGGSREIEPESKWRNAQYSRRRYERRGDVEV